MGVRGPSKWVFSSLQTTSELNVSETLTKNKGCPSGYGPRSPSGNQRYSSSVHGSSQATVGSMQTTVGTISKRDVAFLKILQMLATAIAEGIRGSS